MKATPIRIASIKHFESYDSPLDARELINYLQKKLEVNKVTVFRMLNTFTEKGLLRKLEFGEGKARYELNKQDHHHFICEKCGSIEDISDCNIDHIEKKIQKKKGVLVKRHSLEFFGVCRQCQH